MPTRVRVALACAECGARNYKTTKKQVPGQSELLTMRKYCPPCGKHTAHIETR